MHVSRDDEALHFDALAQQSCCAHGTMTRPANAFCALPHGQGDRAKAPSLHVCALSATWQSHRQRDDRCRCKLPDGQHGGVPGCL